MGNGKGNDRRKELMALFADTNGIDAIVSPMVDDMVFLEGRLSELRKLPFIRVNPKDRSQQKATPAARQYKELLQQYNNCVKILTTLQRRNAPEETSPLRKFIDDLNAGRFDE